MSYLLPRANAAGARALFGAAIWLLTLWHDPIGDLRSGSWSSALLAFAALVLVPLALPLAALVLETRSRSRDCIRIAAMLQFPAALFLVLALRREPGLIAAGLATPWLVLPGIAAIGAVASGIVIDRRSLARACAQAALLFFAVGGAWTFADRAGWRPLDFGADIVQLTAVHFHYAGLVLPLIAALVVRENIGARVARLAACGVLVGVPLVAVAITSSQFGAGLVMELVAAVVLGVSASAIGACLVRLAFRREPRAASVRALWLIAGLSLIFGMALAILYGARGVMMPLPWLDIPWMRALHGTANALGFGTCAIVGWWLTLRLKMRA